MNFAPISVLISTYKNDSPLYLEEALLSLKNQTLLADEIILVIDGYVDESLIKIIENFKYDGKFKYYKLEKNYGLAYCMNYALKKATNDIVARMDADDICFKNKFEMQYNILKKIKNKNTVITSLSLDFIDSIDNIQSLKETPKDNEEIKKILKYRNIVCHPTIMLYKSIFEKYGNYNQNVGLLEDYELHLRLIHNGVQYYCIQEPLIYIRSTEYQVRRRGGFKYYINECKFRYKCYKNNYISLSDFLITIFIYSFFRLAPVKIKKVLYKLVRKSIKEH